MSTTNRRDVLGRLAVASAAGALVAPALAQGATHPDAELLQAGRRWHEAGRIWLKHPDDDVSEAAHAEFERMDARIAALTATTVAGVAVKLRFALLHSQLGLAKAEEGVLCGGPCSADMFGTDSQRTMWQAIATLEQLDGRASA